MTVIKRYNNIRLQNVIKNIITKNKNKNNLNYKNVIQNEK